MDEMKDRCRRATGGPGAVAGSRRADAPPQRGPFPARAARARRRPPVAAVRSACAVILAAALFGSCELLFMAPVPDTSPQSIFDQVWQFADTEYSFFELKAINWDEVYGTYQPQVRANMNAQELFDLLAQMLYELRDGHVNLRSPFDFSRNWQWFLDYPQNFDYTVLERAYFQGNEQYVGPFVVCDFGDVVYAYYGSFGSTVTDSHLDYLFTTFAERDGLILDVRDNGGGSISNAYRIANRFVAERTVVGYQVYKNGPAHDSFTEPEAVVLEPPPGAVLWEKPVVVLTNRSSYSATNLFAALMVDLHEDPDPDRVTLMGDTTGGGGGIPAFTELTNGWVLRVSAHQFFLPGEPEDFNVELGIPPDIKVDMAPLEIDPAEPENSSDTILEAALAWIRGL